MKKRNQLLVLVTALTWFSWTRAEYSCQNFTVTNCEVNRDLFIQDFNMNSTEACQEVCHMYDSCAAYSFYLGHCELWKNNPRTSCAVVSGPPTLDMEQCLTGSIITAGCDGYVEEECEFLGSDTGFTSSPGEIISAVECGELCKVWSDVDPGFCTYWVYNETSQVCHTLDSDQRICLGLTLLYPEIQECPPCKEESTRFQSSEYFNLRPLSWSNPPFDRCNIASTWNLTAGEDGTEIWNQENSCLSAVIGDMMYQDVEFSGSFKALNTDDDSIGFIFGFEVIFMS